MKILCVTSIFPNRLRPNKGIYNWRHFTHLKKHAELRVISPIPWTDDCRARAAHKGRLASDHWQDWNGIDVVYPRHCYTPSAFRGLYGAFMKSSIGGVFRKAVADFQPDVIYACWAYPDGWAAWHLARQARRPVIVKVHGSDLLLLDRDPERKCRTIDLLKGLDAISTVSADLRNCAIRLGTPPERAHLIYEGTDRDLFCPGNREVARRTLGLDPNRARLLFVGNLVPVKAIPNLIEACRQVRASGREFEADIIGDGPLLASLQKLVADSGLDGCVHLRGPILQVDLPDWYRAADLVVLSSHSEGVPNVLVEAAACGTPFVATDVGGISEIAHLSPVPLVPPDNPLALAAAIESVLRDPAAAAARVDGSSIPSVADCAISTLDLFSEVLSRRGATSPAAADPL